MELTIIDSSYNGYLDETSREVEAIGITLEDESLEREDLYQINIAFFEKFLRDLFYVFPGKELYLIKKQEKSGEFNRIEKYKGLWKNSGFKGEKTEKLLNEGGISCLFGFARIMPEEIAELLKISRTVICFSSYDVMANLLNEKISLLKDYSKIKDYLIDENSVLVDHLDLFFDGNSLFFYQKPSLKELTIIKEKCQKYQTGKYWDFKEGKENL